MKNLLVKYNSNYFSIQQNKVVLWLYRVELSFYFTAFLATMYFIFIKSSSRIEVKIGFIVALSIAFLLVVYRKLTSILGRDFYLSRTKYGFIINNKVRTGNIDRGAICIKEMVSTYSAKAYYDISIRVNGKKIPIAFGASEMDKVAILEGLNYFLSSDGESTGEIQEV